MKEQLLSLLKEDYKEFYSRFTTIIDEGNSHVEAKCLCPSHNDRVPSLHINLQSGKWHCKTCGEGGNTPISFYKWLYGTSTPDAVDNISAMYNLVPTPHKDHKAFHDNLLKDAEALKEFKDKRLFTDATLSKYSIGWNGARYTIPIPDISNTIRNIAMYYLGEATEAMPKFKSILSGIGSNRVFPIENLNSKKIYLFEGHLDAMLANQYGINGVTVTCGAKSFNAKMAKYFVNKTVIVCYDVDKAGHDGARKAGKFLLEVTDNVYILDLPKSKLPDKGDFTDFIRLEGIEAFNDLKPTRFTGLSSNEEEQLLEDVHLSEVSKTDNFNKRIRTEVVISGKGEPYFIPSRGKFTCKKQGSCKACGGCKLGTGEGVEYFRVAKDDIASLNFFFVSDAIKDAALKQHFNMSKCAEVVVEAAYTMDELIVIPEINYNNTKSSAYASKILYYIGDKILEANRAYSMEGIVTHNPKTQRATILVYDATPMKDNIEEFEMSPFIGEKLSVFTTSNLEELEAKMLEIHSDYEAVTGIYDRDTLFTAIDLIYHSVLSFDLFNQRIARGHVNGLIFGDTRTGKSIATEKIMHHLKAGEMVGCENMSFAGLVGGVHQLGDCGQWRIAWKVIPLNDRRLVALDEFHQCTVETIGKLSELISTGIASIVKMHTEKTLARTRLIMLANAREGAHLSYFEFGCQAITSIMGCHNEDVARLDFALALSQNDVPNNIMIAKRTKNMQVAKYTSDLCHDLIMWVWSRKATDIVFTPEAESTISDLAEKLAAKYHIALPLVPRAEQHVKLARMAAAVAARTFSTDDTLQKVVVKPYHVQYIYNYLETIYTSKNMKYDLLSKKFFAKDNIKNKDALLNLGISEDIRDLLLGYDKLNLTSLEHIFSVDKFLARTKLSTLLINNALENYGTNMFRKTPAFINFLTEHDFTKTKDNIIREGGLGDAL